MRRIALQRRSRCCSWVCATYLSDNQSIGAGESGKSTILKQMTIIHGKGYSDQEKEAFKEIIFSNTVQSMRVLLEAMANLNIALGKASNDAHKIIILDLSNQIESDEMPQDVTQAIKELWADAGVQACYKRAKEFQINDSAK